MGEGKPFQMSDDVAGKIRDCAMNAADAFSGVDAGKVAEQIQVALLAEILLETRRLRHDVALHFDLLRERLDFLLQR